MKSAPAMSRKTKLLIDAAFVTVAVLAIGSVGWAIAMIVRWEFFWLPAEALRFLAVVWAVYFISFAVNPKGSANG